LRLSLHGGMRGGVWRLFAGADPGHWAQTGFQRGL
jgi:hypothetical protein